MWGFFLLLPPQKMQRSTLLRQLCRGRGCSAGSVAPSSSACWSQLCARRHRSYQLRFLRGQLPSDLKDLNGIIGCLYDSLPDADEYAAYKVPQKTIDVYEQLGYLVTPQPILDHRQCDTLSDEVSQLANNVEHHPRTESLYATSLADLTGGPLFFCQGQWRAAWAMHDLLFHPSLTVAASQLLGNTVVRLWYDEVLMKCARTGPCIPWQQNYARWQHTVPIQHITVMIALDTLTAERGAPCIIPGSHAWRDAKNLLTVPPYDATRDEAAHMNSIWELVDAAEREMLMDTPPETITMQRGQALFLHPMAVYATHGNRTFEPSKCLFIHYFGDQVRTVQPGALLPKTTRFAAGSPIHGPFYPVCFDPSMVEEPAEDGSGSQTALPEGQPQLNQ